MHQSEKFKPDWVVVIVITLGICAFGYIFLSASEYANLQDEVENQRLYAETMVDDAFTTIENTTTLETNDFFVITNAEATHLVTVNTTDNGYTHEEQLVTDKDTTLMQMKETSIKNAQE